MKATSAEDYKLQSSFEAVRKVLLHEKFAERLDKPLAYWALPSDRRLPLAFLGRTLRDLLEASFEELTSTPGIGQKKIGSLVKLLHRATGDGPPLAPFGINNLLSEGRDGEQRVLSKNGRFDPAVVSEALWARWRETIRQHDVLREKLGRLAPSLQALPTVIWHTPLSAYVNQTLAEIRQLKTHGEKRVRVVLEVFYVVHEMVRDAGLNDRLTVRLTPKFIPPLEEWIWTAIRQDARPNRDQMGANLARPLLDQIGVDAGQTVRQLASERLGVEAPPQSVRAQSRRMGVTRARVYQLLDECASVMDVRWPEGRCHLAALAENLHRRDAEVDAMELLQAIRELLFPVKPEEPASSGSR
jgi:hypothetical protein